MYYGGISWGSPAIIAVLSYYVLDTTVRVTATVAALYAGYHWERGHFEEGGAASGRGHRREIDTRTDGHQEGSTCLPPAGATSWAYLVSLIPSANLVLRGAASQRLWATGSPPNDDASKKGYFAGGAQNVLRVDLPRSL